MKKHTCDCGFTWRHGHSGAHSCDPYYRKTIAELRAAAAPQVVADERAAFESDCGLHETVMARNPDSSYWNYLISARWEGWQARAALAAAPVQAQEPFMFGIMGPDGKAHMDEHCVAPDAASLYDELNGLNDSPDTGYSIVPLFRAPVQPMAVPDGVDRAALFNEEQFAHMLNRLSVANRREGWTTNDPWKDREHLKRASDSVAYAEKEIRDYIVSLLAAPAAQGAPACSGCGATAGADCNDRGCGGLDAGNGEPAAQGDAQPFKWPNGCDRTIPKALRYLARNDRPSGGEDVFNGMHLLQLADEMDAAVQRAAIAAKAAS